MPCSPLILSEEGAGGVVQVLRCGSASSRSPVSQAMTGICVLWMGSARQFDGQGLLKSCSGDGEWILSSKWGAKNTSQVLTKLHQHEEEPRLVGSKSFRQFNNQAPAAVRARKQSTIIYLMHVFHPPQQPDLMQGVKVDSLWAGGWMGWVQGCRDKVTTAVHSTGTCPQCC